MKNLIYITYFDLFKSDSIGVKNKILGQLNAANKLNINTILFFISDEHLVGLDANDEIIYKIKIEKGYTNYRHSVLNEMKKLSKKIRFDIVYLRFPGSIDFSILKTFKFFSQVSNDVYLELPTYPIKGELKIIIKKKIKEKKYFNAALRLIVYIVHFLNSRVLLKRYIKSIITFMPYKKIWNIPTIQLDNGVDIDQYPVITNRRNYMCDSEINLVGVANLSIWHGYDRVIVGLKEYYENKNSKDVTVNFIIVGDGVETTNLKNMVKTYNLDKYVKFKGVLDREYIKEIYRVSDIAIGSLGMHRISVLNGSTLKVKEFCASGIPFIYAYNELLIPDNWEYALKIPANELAVDISQIIKFYNKIKLYDNYSDKMNEFAVNNFSWDCQMKKILSKYIE